MSRKTRKRRPPLTLEAITDAAIRIADAEGLDAVSIRRIAAELDARPMSLYDHIGSKGDLFSAMAEEIIAEVIVPPPLPADWRQALHAIARRSYATFIGHPWLVTVFGRNPRFGPNATKLAKQAADATAGLPLESEDRWLIHGTMNDYVLGHSLRAIAAPSANDLEDVISEDDLAEYPEIAALPDSLRSRASVERFEAGLQTLLDGVEKRFLEDGD